MTTPIFNTSQLHCFWSLNFKLLNTTEKKSTTRRNCSISIRNKNFHFKIFQFQYSFKQISNIELNKQKYIDCEDSQKKCMNIFSKKRNSIHRKIKYLLLKFILLIFHPENLKMMKNFFFRNALESIKNTGKFFGGVSFLFAHGKLSRIDCCFLLDFYFK